VLKLHAPDDVLDGDHVGPDEEHTRRRGRGDGLGAFGRHGERAQEAAEVEDVDVAGLPGCEALH
jgi:hypothetical protein